MSVDRNFLKEKLAQLQNQNKKSDLIWKPTAKSVIRIVPYKKNPENPFIELFFHYDIGGKTYLSPVTFGKPDPIEQFAKNIRANGKVSKEDYILSKKLEPTMRTYVPIIVRGEESKGVKYWGFGKTVYETLLTYMNDSDYEDIVDPTNGRDITVEFKSAEETGKNYPTTTIMIKPKTSPMTTDTEVIKLIQEQRDILDLYKEPTYEELADALKDWLKVNNDADSEETEDTETVEEEHVSQTAPQKENTTNVTTSGVNLQEKFNNLFNK